SPGRIRTVRSPEKQSGALPLSYRGKNCGLSLSLLHQGKARKGQQATGMVEQFDQVIEEHVLADQRKKWQREGVSRHRDQRFRDVSRLPCRMFGKVAAAQQGTLQ